MDSTLPLARRRLLAGVGSVLLAMLAGCSGSEGSDESDGGSDGGTTTDATTETPTESTTDLTTDITDDDAGNDLDRREANVVGVEFEAQDGSYRFDVTLHHDDEGEDGYANWWQVEELSGTRLGRRELLHPHSQQPFTRSTTVEIPADVGCVVVRGHDETHGYGGLVVLVDLESGATRTLDQGPERQSVGPDDCP